VNALENFLAELLASEGTADAPPLGVREVLDAAAAEVEQTYADDPALLERMREIIRETREQLPDDE